MAWWLVILLVATLAQVTALAMHRYRDHLSDETDDELELLFGDTGMIYFWIRRQDAQQQDFDTVWLILQCC